MSGKSLERQLLGLSVEELVHHWGKPSETRPFDAEHAASYRTWLAIANYVAYHDARFLNALFQGIEFPDSKLDHGAISFPAALEEAMSPQTKMKYAHLRLNPRHYGSMETRLRLFQNIVDVTGDRCANFQVGRNIRVNPDMGALKATFQTGAKGLLKVLGVNPAKILAQRMPDANRALNNFLDTRVVQYGHNFMDVRVEYFTVKDVSAEGDHYTLGTILGGMEQLGEYRKITIRALQTPFDETREQIKQQVQDPGVRYVFDGYTHDPESPVFLYRYEFRQQAQFLRRVARALGDVARRGLPSRLTKAELRQEEERRRMLDQEKELDVRTKTEYEARIAVEQSRADAAEAKLTLEQQVSGVNRTFGQIRTLAHDNKNHGLALLAEAYDFNKNHGLALLAETYDLLRETMKGFSQYAEATQGLLQNDEKIRETVENLLADPALPEPLFAVASYIKAVHENVNTTVESYTKAVHERVNTMIENDRSMMSGGLSVVIKELSYASLLDPVIRDVRRIYPGVHIHYEDPLGMSIQGDERLLKAAFTNLVRNAVEASLPNGSITLAQIQKRRAERDFTIITVTQSGLLPPEIADKLNVGEGFTTKPDGNATGAAASYNIIKGPHNGSIQYESLGERGGKVTVII